MCLCSRGREHAKDRHLLYTESITGAICLSRPGEHQPPERHDGGMSSGMMRLIHRFNKENQYCRLLEECAQACRGRDINHCPFAIYYILRWNRKYKSAVHLQHSRSALTSTTRSCGIKYNLYALFPETLKEPNILRDARANRQPKALVLLPKTTPFPFQPEQQGTRRPPHLVAFSRPDHPRKRVALEGPLELAHDRQQAARDAERLAFLVRQHTCGVQ